MYAFPPSPWSNLKPIFDPTSVEYPNAFRDACDMATRQSGTFDRIDMKLRVFLGSSQHHSHHDFNFFGPVEVMMPKDFTEYLKQTSQYFANRGYHRATSPTVRFFRETIPHISGPKKRVMRPTR